MPMQWMWGIKEREEPRVNQYVWPTQLELPFIELGRIIGISLLEQGKKGRMGSKIFILNMLSLMCLLAIQVKMSSRQG